jgi:hypothetical protein
MIKTVNKAAILAWLKEQVDDAFEGFLEDMNDHLGEGGDWEPVNDDTTNEALGLLINHESEIVKILVKHRLAGHSVSGPEVHQELDNLLQSDTDHEKFDMGFKQGRFYTLAKLYEELGKKDLAAKWKSWAWLDPYN